jgi:hypothetical protein
VSNTIERRDWTIADWHPARLHLDEDMGIQYRRVSVSEELLLVIALIALGAAIVFLIWQPIERKLANPRKRRDAQFPGAPTSDPTLKAHQAVDLGLLTACPV